MAIRNLRRLFTTQLAHEHFDEVMRTIEGAIHAIPYDAITYATLELHLDRLVQENRIPGLSIQETGENRVRPVRLVEGAGTREERAVEGVEITFELPFEGRPALFELKPITHNNQSPTIHRLEEGRILLSYEFATRSPVEDEVYALYRNDVENLKRWTGNLNKELDVFNAHLRELLRGVLEERARTHQALEALGERLRSRIEGAAGKTGGN